MMSYKIFENFLSPNNFSTVQNECKKIWLNKDNNFKINFNFWPEYIVLDSKAVLSFGITSVSPIYKIISDQCLKSFNKSVDVIMFYYWTPGSYIPWHNDGHFKHAATLYLNEKWDKNWGGYYMAEENNKIESIKPSKNLLILQSDHINHSTTITSPSADIRATVQMFFRDDRNN